MNEPVSPDEPNATTAIVPLMTLYEQGLGFTEISSRVGVSRRTIERWMKAGDFPEAQRRRKRRSVFDPYADYVLSRWEQGCTNGLQLWLFARAPDSLEEKEPATLTAICQASETARTTYQFVQECAAHPSPS